MKPESSSLFPSDDVFAEFLAACLRFQRHLPDARAQADTWHHACMAERRENERLRAELVDAKAKLCLVELELYELKYSPST